MIIRKFYSFGTRYLGPLKKYAKWIAYKSLFAPHEKNMAILCTVPKSGTNRFKLFLANYIGLMHLDIQQPVTYDQMMRGYFVNLREEYTSGITDYRRPAPIFSALPFDDFTHTHGTQFLEYFKGKLICLYRNPLDYIVSMFYYRYKYRPERSARYASITDVVEILTQDYLNYYLMMAALRKDQNIFTFTYEDMMRYPEPVFHSALNWLNMPVDVHLLSKATAYSDINRVRQFEKEHGPIHSPAGFTGLFTRSGKIGQWKEHLSDQDVDRAEAILGQAGVHLHSFTVE